MSVAGSDVTRIAVRTADGLSLAGDVLGPDAGARVIFLHGGGQSRSAWRGAARRLAAAGFRACTMDLRGHGDSDWSEAQAYGFDDYVADLRATISALGDQPAILVGASLGGHIAMLAAARHPHLVRALLLADVTPWIDEARGREVRDSMRASAAGFASVQEAAESVAALRGEVARPASALDGLRRHLREGDDGRLYWRWDVRLVSEDHLMGGGEGGLFQTEAAKVRAPILVMHAEHSTLTTEAEIAGFRSVQPDLNVTMIAGAGHMVTGDVNDAYADAILDFIGRAL